MGSKLGLFKILSFFSFIIFINLFARITAEAQTRYFEVNEADALYKPTLETQITDGQPVLRVAKPSEGKSFRIYDLYPYGILSPRPVYKTESGKFGVKIILKEVDPSIRTNEPKLAELRANVREGIQTFNIQALIKDFESAGYFPDPVLPNKALAASDISEVTIEFKFAGRNRDVVLDLRSIQVGPAQSLIDTADFERLKIISRIDNLRSQVMALLTPSPDKPALVSEQVAASDMARRRISDLKREILVVLKERLKLNPSQANIFLNNLLYHYNVGLSTIQLLDHSFTSSEAAYRHDYSGYQPPKTKQRQAAESANPCTGNLENLK